MLLLHLKNKINSFTEDHHISTTRRETGSDSYQGSNRDHVDSITTQVVNSPAYQDAHKILSAEPDKQWLYELESIPYAVQDAPAENPLFGWASNKYEDKQNANYQYCMELIRDLMARYHEWKNSLPVTQAQQYADAGYNAAITGDGLSPSTTGTPSSPTASPSSMESMSVADTLSSVVGTVMSIDQGIVAWFNQFKDVSQFNKGYDLQLKDMDLDFAKFNKELADHGIFGITPEYTANQVVARLYNSEYFDNQQVRQIIDQFNLETEHHFAVGLNNDILDNLKEFTTLRYDIFKSNVELQKLLNERSMKQAQYESGYYGNDPESFGQHMGYYDVHQAASETESLEYDSQIAEIESKISKALGDYVDKLESKSNRGDATATYLLNQILSGITPYDVGAAQKGGQKVYRDASYIGPAMQGVGSAMSLIGKRGKGSN